MTSNILRNSILADMIIGVKGDSSDSPSITINDYMNRRITVDNSNTAPWHTTSIDSSVDNSDGFDKSSLTFLEMKIRNKDIYMEVDMIYIDKATYEEVIQTFKCNASLTHTFTCLTSNECSDMKIKLSQIREEVETRNTI